MYASDTQEYRRGGPGPWDPLPTGASKKDGWGRRGLASRDESGNESNESEG